MCILPLNCPSVQLVFLFRFAIVFPLQFLSLFLLLLSELLDGGGKDSCSRQVQALLYVGERTAHTKCEQLEPTMLCYLADFGPRSVVLKVCRST
jgi:hypothetical protein